MSSTPTPVAWQHEGICWRPIAWLCAPIPSVHLAALSHSTARWTQSWQRSCVSLGALLSSCPCATAHARKHTHAVVVYVDIVLYVCVGGSSIPAHPARLPPPPFSLDPSLCLPSRPTRVLPVYFTANAHRCLFTSLPTHTTAYLFHCQHHSLHAASQEVRVPSAVTCDSVGCQQHTRLGPNRA